MTRQLKADLAILGITVVWGSSFIIMKNITEDIPPYAYLALRFLVAAIILIAVFHRQLKSINLRSIWSGSLVGLTLYAGMMLQVTGLKTTSASNSAFITGLNVIMVPIISVLLLKKKPPINALFGVVLASLGLFVLKGFSGNWTIGDTLTLLCALCFALQIIFIDKFASDVNIYHLAIVQIASAAIFYIITWICADMASAAAPFVIDSKIILTVLYTGALGTALGFGVQTIAQKYTTPTRTALIITCEPVFGALFALIIPDVYGKTEVMTIRMILGCLLILSGMLITELDKRTDVLS
ncbi:MAG: DMT family transporter [Acetivibrionales bacterium]|jgi:drug/metabolite transporter (DMT)-like permease